MSVQHKIEELERKTRAIKIQLQKTLEKRDKLYERILLTHNEHKQLVASLTKIQRLHMKLTFVLTKLHFLKGNEEIEPFNLFE